MTDPEANMTGKEFLESLMRKPEYVAMRKAQDAKIAAMEALLSVDEAALIADLSAVGEPLRSVWDLVNRNGPPIPAAINVLAAHLGKPHHYRTLEGIVRALTVPEAKGTAGRTLMSSLECSTSAEEKPFRWAVLNALAVVGDRSLLESLEVLIARGVLAEQGDRIINAALRGCKKRKAQS